MSELNVSNAPQGKGMAVTGFVLSLVGLIFSSWIAAIAVLSIATGGSAWLMYFWLVLCIASVVLSVMGMSKLGKTGGKKGLGIAGMVIGIVATIYSIILVLGLSVAASAADSVGSEALQDAMEDMQNR
jgi:hypothetical protein